MTIRRSPRRRFAGCVGAVALGLSAAEPTMASDATAAWSSRLEQNRPWQALNALGDAPESAQIAAQISVFLGRERPACTAPRAVDGAEYRDALEVVVRAARDARVVMLNESHVRRAHRVFLGRLIEALHPLGFDALAAETFAPQAPVSLQDGVPDTATGFYSADPAFAAALRRAHALDWTFVPYEPENAADREARESGQAEALARWLDAHPGRRLLVYAGGSHISKDPEAGWMAARFAARTGIVPLTVAQGATACASSTENDLGENDRGEAEPASVWPVDAAAPVVAMRDGTPLAPAHVDLVVMHPPAAVAAAEDALGTPVSLCVPPRADATLLRAFAEREDDHAIAHDQAVVPAGAATARLRLAPGRYRIAREDAAALNTLGHVSVPAESSESCLRIDTR